MPKYDTRPGADNDRSEERQIARWKEYPFTSHDKRSWTVHHRIVADAHPGVGADIRHEVKCRERDAPEGWRTAEVYEVRQHGVDRVTASSEWWQ